MVSLRKIGLVLRREYTTRVQKKSFVVLTLLTPLLFVLITLAPALILQFMSDSREVIAVIDRTGLYSDLLESSDSYTFVPADKPLSTYRSGQDVEDVTAILEIRQNLLEDPSAISLFSYKTLPSSVENYINQRLSHYLSEQKLNSYNIPELHDIVRNSQIELSVATYIWNEDGAETSSSGTVASTIGMILNMATYIFIMIYGMMVLQGVIEEKKNRIMEVMLSCLRPFELMMGKIIGIGLVGLTQITVWGILTFVLLIGVQFAVFGGLYSGIEAESLGASTAEATEQMQMMRELFAGLQSINFVELGVLFVGYFIGGYLLYSSILAAMGSTISSEEDAAQITTPISLVMMLSFYIGIACSQNPEGNLAIWASLVPFTSPIVMMARLPYGVPLWQQVLSLLLLFGSSIGFTALGAKIYRVGVLMYGKRATLREIWQWLRY